MKISPKLMLFIAVILLTLAYIFPLWKIDLHAPQYPEGIGLRIWADKITGLNPHDLKNINGLNHYIGMKKIDPDSIPELSFMPAIIGVMIFLLLITLWFNRKWLLKTWLIIMFVIMAAGIVDFYKWEYDYGHNLNPKAAIKIPGMSYQPPLIGSKQLLNMNASSWPHIGGWAILASTLLVMLALKELSKSENSNGETDEN